MIKSSAARPVEKRRGASRALLIALAGPGIGSLLMLVVILAMSGVGDESDFWTMLPRVIALVLIIGYMAGIVPSIVSALIWHFGLSRIGSPVLRILGCGVTGAAAGSLLVWPAMVLMFGQWGPDAGFYLWSAGAGAAALMLAAQPWKAEP